MSLFCKNPDFFSGLEPSPVPKGDALYKAYQSWAQLEQEAADQEQLDREYELAERKRQDANAQFKLEFDSKNSKEQEETGEPTADYYA